MILNKTNAIVIARIYGKQTDAWLKKPIEVYHDPNVMLGREKVGGIRVRAASVVQVKIPSSPAKTTMATSKPSQHAGVQE